jgi:hypothetical protein
LLSALALIAVIIAGCLAAAASGPRSRDDFMSQPLVPHVLTAVTPADAHRSRLLLP